MPKKGQLWLRHSGGRSGERENIAAKVFMDHFYLISLYFVVAFKSIDEIGAILSERKNKFEQNTDDLPLI